MRGRWDAKNNPRDYGIARNLGSDYGIEKPYWGRSILADNFPNVTFISVNSGNTTM